MAAKKILLVEGKDDEHVLKHLCGSFDPNGQRRGPWLDEVKPLESVEKLLENFPVRLKMSQADDIVGVVIDADTDLDSRWRALRDRLLGAGYENQDVPDDPAPEGTVVDPPAETLLPRVGIWIMPNNQTKGILVLFPSIFAGLRAPEKKFQNGADFASF